MNTRKVEVAIIGTGTAGMTAYRAARKKTDSIVLIEGGAYGTTCARVGCMPSKLLIASAETAHTVNHAGEFGVQVSAMSIDGEAVFDRVRKMRDDFVSSVIKSVEGFDEKHKVKGMARFKDDHTLVVDEQLEVLAERIVIATGSRPNIPGMLEKAGDRLLTNDNIFELEELPASVAVFGPGVIGLELGQALSRLGVKVKMFGRSGSLAILQDKEIRNYADDCFNQEFYLDTEAGVEDVSLSDAGVEVTFIDKSGRQQTETFDYVLAATGRRPNTDQLGLENTSLELDDKGGPVFDEFTMQTSLEHIFIAGDANNELPLLHEAADEGRIAGGNAASFPEVRAGMRRAPIAVVFTQPQIAQVGLKLNELQEEFPNCFATGQVSFEDQGRSRVIGKNQGILKVYGQRGTGRFLGAEMFGPAAEHIAHLLAWSYQQHMTVNQMLEMPFYHPVIEEGLRTALRDLNAQLRKGPEPVANSLDCGPGG